MHNLKLAAVLTALAMLTACGGYVPTCGGELPKCVSISPVTQRESDGGPREPQERSRERSGEQNTGENQGVEGTDAVTGEDIGFGAIGG